MKIFLTTFVICGMATLTPIYAADGVKPIDQAQFVLNEGDLDWIHKTQSYMVQVQYPDASGSGVYLGRTEQGLGIILMSGHTVPRYRLNVAHKSGIRLDWMQIDPKAPHSILSSLKTFVTPFAEFGEKHAGRVTFPFFHPEFPLVDGKRGNIPASDDFSFAIMGAVIEPGMTVETALAPANAYKSPDIPDLKFAKPIEGEEVLLLGVTSYLGNIDRILTEEEPATTRQKSFGTSRVLSVSESEQWAEQLRIPFDPLSEIYVEGGADGGFSGGGIFNRRGELIAIVTKGLKPLEPGLKWAVDRLNQNFNPVDLVIGTRIDHILNYAAEHSHGPASEALKNVLARRPKNSCNDDLLSSFLSRRRKTE